MLHVVHMNGEHPIDDLFARGLREAGSTPPPAVWEGIVRKRGAWHRRLLQPRRRPLYALLLLLLAGGVYRMGSTDAPPPTVAGTDPTTLEQGIAPQVRTRPAGSTTPEHTSGQEDLGFASSTTDTPVSAEPSGEVGGGPTARPLQKNAPSPVLHAAHGSIATPRLGGATPAGDLTMASGARHPGGSSAGLFPHGDRRMAATGGVATPITSLPEGADARAQDPAPHRVSPDMEASTHEAAHHGTARLQLLGAELLPTVPTASPQGGKTVPYVRPDGNWWIGVHGTLYGERRHWEEGDPSVRAALNDAENGRRAWGLGLLGGRTWNSGWRIGTGVEWVDARYDFQHVERQRISHTEINSYVVSLGSDVLMNMVDSVTTVEEQERTVRAINRYRSLRIPIDVAWEQPWRRWHYGLRTGLAYEHASFREGTMLLREPADGDAAASIQPTDITELSYKDRVSQQVTASVGLHLRYTLDQAWALWCGPQYTRGLFTIRSGDLPQPLAERYGLTMGITYTLPRR